MKNPSTRQIEKNKKIYCHKGVLEKEYSILFSKINNKIFQKYFDKDLPDSYFISKEYNDILFGIICKDKSLLWEINNFLAEKMNIVIDFYPRTYVSRLDLWLHKDPIYLYIPIKNNNTT